MDRKKEKQTLSNPIAIVHSFCSTHGFKKLKKKSKTDVCAHKYTNSFCKLRVICCTPNKFGFWSNARQNSFVSRKKKSTLATIKSHNRIPCLAHTHTHFNDTHTKHKSARVYVIMIFAEFATQMYTKLSLKFSTQIEYQQWKREKKMGLECWKYVKNEDKTRKAFQSKSPDLLKVKNQ